MLPSIDLTDPGVLADPFAAHGRARELSPVVTLDAPGMPPMWTVTRHAEGRAALADARLEMRPASFAMRPDVPEHCRPYMRSMQEVEGEEHARLRRAVAPAFTRGAAEDFRERAARLAGELLDGLSGETDLLAAFARPLPSDVIAELVGVPATDRPQWREWGAAVSIGHGPAFAAAIPGIVDAARRAVHHEGVLTALAHSGLDGTELAALVWQLLLGGQTPTNLIANAVRVLLTTPGAWETLRDDESLLPGAVEELTRWCGPQLMTFPRFAREDVEVGGVTIPAGSMVTVSIAAANRDPRVFAEPERLDLRRESCPHLGYAHGPHFCLGAPLARVQTEEALRALLRRFPKTRAADTPAHWLPDPGTLRLAALPVVLG
ncbi:cytochrome P450 [Actinorhabdospora filicis]|uniref:Cytochrome P450 n=1 Tax=Actinorhabdospora filicis TaxID=1785913 RepID=A0A9W6SHA9_9ACTN|nr:cytochrome P450 [Actinorhabdospora filicis]GLZ75975.1 cytochrome P450 [Actinorhabdospora filicis]